MPGRIFSQPVLTVPSDTSSAQGVNQATINQPDKDIATASDTGSIGTANLALNVIRNTTSLVQTGIDEFRNNVVDPATNAILNRFNSQSNADSQQQTTTAIETSLNTVNNALSSDISIDNISPNFLSTYDNPSYHFKFFITALPKDPDSLNTLYENIDQYQQYVIAETGVTGYYITDVTISSVPSPSAKNLNTFENQIEMTIVEPFGCRLIDHIVQGCAELGIPNYIGSFYWLELYFDGYETGSNELSSNGGTPRAPLLQQKWLWSVKIVDMNISLNKGGTEYKITMVPSEEAAHTDSAKKTEKKTTFTGVKTFGDFITKLQDALNKNKFNSLGITTTDPDVDKYGRSPDSYQIHVYDQVKTLDPKLSDMSNWLVRNPIENQTNTKRSASIIPTASAGGGREDTWDISFAEGTSIDIMITEVLGSTLEGQSLILYGKYVTNLASINLEDPTNARPIYNPAVAFVVDTITTITSYSYERNNYSYRYDYYIRPYRTFDTVVSRNEIAASKDLQDAQRRLSNKAKFTKMNKKYDYIYTGLNTEVINFDISLNTAWFLGLPKFQGQNRSDASTVGGQKPNIDQYKIVQQQNQQAVNQNNKQLPPIISYLSYLDNSTADQVNAADAALLPIQTPNSPIIRNPIQFVQNSPVFNTNLQTGENSEFRQTTNVINSVVINNVLQKSTSDRMEISTPTPVTNSGTSANGSIYYVEDIQTNLDQLQGSGTEVDSTVATGKLNNIPSEIRSSSNFVGNIEGTISKGRSYFSFIMNQCYGLDGKMIDIVLDIRGDPYWLGEPNPMKRIKADNELNKESADLTNGDATFILSMGFPQHINDYSTANTRSSSGDTNEYSYAGTGLIEVDRTLNGFNGIYTAREIRHTFSNGKFTQQLFAYADFMIREDDVISLIKRLDNE